jgi:tRNA(Arg) A34 adenosine deaminase TadA
MSLLSDAIVAAYTSAHKYQVGAAVYDKHGKLIAKGWNKTKSHPYQSVLANRVNQPSKIYLHAEVAAILAAIKTGRIPHTIIVTRVTRRDTLSMAKPCEICQLAIKEAGIKLVGYTDGKGVMQYVSY